MHKTQTLCARLLWTACLLLCASLSASTQEQSFVNTYEYNVNQGLLQSNILDAECDEYGRLWLSFTNGLQRFNGLKLEHIPPQIGLPDDQFIRFLKLSNGNMLFFHKKGISRFVEQQNKFEWLCQQPLQLNIGQIYLLGEWQNHVYFISGKTLLTYNVKSSTIHQKPMPDWLYRPISPNEAEFDFSNVDNGRIVLATSKQWQLVELASFERRHSGKFSSSRITGFKPFLQKDTFVTASYEHQKAVFYAIDLKTNQAKKMPLFFESREKPFVKRVGNWPERKILQVKTQTIQLDQQWLPIKSILKYDAGPVATETSKHLRDDRGNEYFISISKGFTFLPANNLPFRYFYNQGVPNQNIIHTALSNDEQLILTTGSGISAFDQEQNLKHQLTSLAGKHFPLVTQVIERPDGGYLFTTFSPFQIWGTDRQLQNPYPLKYKIMGSNSSAKAYYFTKTLRNNNNNALLSQGNILIKTDWPKNITVHEFPNLGYTMSANLVDSNVWMHSNDTLYFISLKDFKVAQSKYFPNTGNVRCYQNLSDGRIAMGTNKGVFIVDKNAKVLEVINRKNGLTDECIYSIEEDKNGNLWCSSNVGIFQIGTSGEVVLYTKEDGLQENEFNTNVSLKTSDGEMFFGGVNGLNSFSPAQITDIVDSPEFRLTDIKINNKPAYTNQSLIFLSDITLPYNENSISMDWVALGKTHPKHYTYQYRIADLNEEWQVFTPGQNLRLLLPPGEYELELFAAKSFQPNAKASKIFKISITPPFWKTIWFLLATALALALTTILAVRQVWRRKLKKQNALQESEREIQNERERISRDLHDHIGAYANALIYNTEMMQQDSGPSNKKEQITDLKFAAKDILTALRETVWALKKQSYSVEETYMRIRNYAQSIRSYYPDIKFQVSGDANANNQLSNQLSLNIVRIVQEAITNALKHSKASRIAVDSVINENKDWTISVSDNGTGFDIGNAQAEHTGNGLSNMAFRAEQLGIKYHISSSTEGTTIRLIIPLIQK